MLTEKQKQAARMLGDGKRVTYVANTLRVHRSTIWRWSKNKDFHRECKRVERNVRRRLRRAFKIIDAVEDAYWAKKQAECKKKLYEEAQKMTGKPSKTREKVLEKAWEEYKKALFYGMKWDDVIDLLNH